MRQLLAVILASTFLSSAPVVFDSQPAQAQTLFEALFPRAAERRRKREELRKQRERELLQRQRQARGGGRSVRGPTFKTYTPMQLQPVRFSRLESAFAAHEQKLLISEPLQAPVPVESVPTQTLPDKQVSVEAVKAKVGTAELENATVTMAIEKPDPVESALDSGSEIVTQGVKPQKIDPVDMADADGASTQLPMEAETSALPKRTMPKRTMPEQTIPEKKLRLSAGHGHLGLLEVRARKSLGDALVSHYQANPEFIWVNGRGEANERANAVLRILADADSYGLRIEDYSLPLNDVGEDASREELNKASMTFEFSLSVAVLRYMADAKHGLVDPNKISGYHDFADLNADYGGNLTSLHTAQAPAQLMLDQHPQATAFQALKRELTIQRASAVGFESIEIAPGTFLRPGQNNDQLENIVESIRRKAPDELLSDHFDIFALSHEEGEYTDAVVSMIRDFQKLEGLRSDGIIGKNTISKMQASDPDVRLKQVLYAMERLRWHPDTLGNTHVFINQPAYKASYMKNGRAELSMRAIVGKPSNQTNFFYDKIEYVEYNPYWGVPRSILVNEMLPKLINNPGYLDNLGYEVTTQNGRHISSYSVDWWNVGNDFPFNVRQPPGPKNALGELKIMFPNKHSIYMHDTPAKSLFSRDRRAFSHGCVRLSQPRAMAAAVLGSDISSVESRLYGGENNQQRLNKEIPVYVAYFTAWPNDGGKVQFYNDVYGRDAALGRAMKLEASTREQARNV